jgi:hypothetical protein
MKPIARELLHDQHCRCTACRPAERESAEFLSANDMALITIAGLIVGLILCEIWRWAVNGPGVIPELGL